MRAEGSRARRPAPAPPKMPAGFEGGQTPIDMRLGKLRGNTSADAMPIGPFRTHTQPVNVGELERRFEAGAEVTPETLKATGLVRKLSMDVKVLGEGELTKKLSVSAHVFSKSAVGKIEAAGGTVIWLREPVVKKRKRHKAAAPAAEEPETSGTEAEETTAEPAGEEEETD